MSIRVMIINYGPSAQIDLVVNQTVGYDTWRLQTGTPATQPEGTVPYTSQAGGTSRFALPAGTIVGLFVNTPPTIRNPDPTNIAILAVSDKDPWPPPPPPPSTLAGLPAAEYAKRFKNFLTALVVPGGPTPLTVTFTP